jgi:hypothetical protein
MVTRITAILAACAALVTSSAAAAQFSEGPLPRDGACFYQDNNFRGPSFCVEAGDALNMLPSGTNDRVSSIRLFGQAVVTVYDNTRFGGESLRFDSDVRDLERENFNDVISSIRVDGGSFGDSRWRSSLPSFRSQSPEAIVRRAYQDVLERDPDPVGMRTYRSHIIDDGWTEQQVRDALRRSPEYREKNTMTREKAEEIVRNAYRAALNREPDAGSAGYVNRVLRERWTQADVERELRRSPEYRNNVR